MVSSIITQTFKRIPLALNGASIGSNFSISTICSTNTEIVSLSLYVYNINNLCKILRLEAKLATIFSH